MKLKHHVPHNVSKVHIWWNYENTFNSPYSPIYTQSFTCCSSLETFSPIVRHNQVLIQPIFQWFLITNYPPVTKSIQTWPLHHRCCCWWSPAAPPSPCPAPRSPPPPSPWSGATGQVTLRSQVEETRVPMAAWWDPVAQCVWRVMERCVEVWRTVMESVDPAWLVLITSVSDHWLYNLV